MQSRSEMGVCMAGTPDGNLCILAGHSSPAVVYINVQYWCHLTTSRL